MSSASNLILVDNESTKEVLATKVKQMDDVAKGVGESKSATVRNGKLESMLQKLEKRDDAIRKSSNKFVSATSDESCKSLLK